MSKDPVCGMDVQADKASHKSTYEGQEQVFCSSECKDKFEKNPDQYAGASTARKR